MTAVNQGAEEDYLGFYKRLLNTRQQQEATDGKEIEEVCSMDAVNQLGTVRLFLAQYFARCAVLGGSGPAPTR